MTIFLVISEVNIPSQHCLRDPDVITSDHSNQIIVGDNYGSLLLVLAPKLKLLIAAIAIETPTLSSQAFPANSTRDLTSGRALRLKELTMPKADLLECMV
jgi:hypothetical protein